MVNCLPLLIALTIGLSQAVYKVNEEDESGQGSVLSVCLEANGTTARDIVVALSASDGTAIGTVYLFLHVVFIHLLNCLLCRWSGL